MDQLSSTITSNSNGNAVDTMECSPPTLTRKKKKEFDFSRYPRRRIALMFLYLGWGYDGLVTQENTKNTIEEAILEALERTKLIENREIAMWTRCGRTDKGVSGFRQIGSVTVRSTDVNGEGVYWPEGSNEDNRVSTTAELPYDRILNQVLPSDIRVIAWSPAKIDFNARFECSSRAYIYLFPKGRLNIEAMQLAGSLLVGHHDFRNFCVIDMNSGRLKTSYERDIYEAQISPINNESGPYQMFQLKIRSSGFLWHQIRCIVAILYEVGLGRELPNVISELLNVEQCPAKPQYTMARDLPLCFFDATYSNDLFDWKSCVNREVLQKVFQQLQVRWCELETQASIVRQMLNELNTFGFDFDHAENMDIHIIGGGSRKNQHPLMKRPRCDSLEVKREKLCKKSKISIVDEES